MKNLLFPLAVAAFCGLPVASALNADNARVTLDVSNGGDLRVESVSPMTIFGGKDAKQSRTDKSTTWQYVTIPLKVEAKCKGDRSPNYVDELKVHVYAVFGGEKGDEPIMLDKEITYVDIPVNGKSGGKLSEGHMNVGIFISPANASKIINSNSKVELGDKLIAVAIEASFHDSPCIAGDTEPYAVVDAKYKQKLTGAWWKKTSKNKQGAELSAISETPFAPFYAPVFPPTKPLYGSAEGSGSASYSSSDADSDTTTDSTVSDSDTTTSVTTGTGKKSKKK
ncbi:MAG: hypothetical protein MJ051_02535 [Akkermansia sp.]|nr:hypothetical protein [Akkermansia sp.]